jgi:hypothetical protein
MKNKIIILLSSFFLTTMFSQAQVGLNTQTLSGYTYLGFTNTYHHKSSHDIYSASFNPSYGKFLGHKTLFKLQPVLGFSRFKGNTESKNELDISNLGISAAMRYYFYTFFNSKFYGESGLSVEMSSMKYTDSKLNSKRSTSNLWIAVGANYFLNKTVALNAQLGYKKNDIFSKINEKTDDFNFRLNLENFINHENEVAEGQDLIKQGRISIDGNFDILANRNATFYQLNAAFSTFFTNGFLIGGKINGTKAEYDPKIVSVQVNTRYYFGVNKKLFLYPEMKLTYANYWFKKYYLDLNIGMNYFIKKNLALEVDLLGLNLTKAQAVTSIGANLGLKYFLK